MHWGLFVFVENLFMSNYNLYHGDCLEVMKQIPDNSVDVIICDPPFGTTPLLWDSIIPFDKLWEQFNRITKQTSPVVIFGQEPFSSYVRMSNIKQYRYDWYWEKERLTNVFQVKKRPGKTVESIMVFYREQCIYNPQKHEHEGLPVKNKVKKGCRFSITQAGYDSTVKPLEYIDDGTRHPTQVLRINRDNPRQRLHPTQKPVSLLEYLINTYSNEGMTILDPTMGSGSTGIACLNTNRNFIGIELDDGYYNVAEQRIRKHNASNKSEV